MRNEIIKLYDIQMLYNITFVSQALFFTFVLAFFLIIFWGAPRKQTFIFFSSSTSLELDIQHNDPF